jgi:hypothetical protein
MQNWTYQKTISPAEEYAVEYRIKVGDSYETRSDNVTFASQSEVITEYQTLNYIDKDGKEQKQDVTAVTIATTTTCVGAANPTRWKSKLEAGSPAFPLAELTKRIETFNKYIITEDGPVESEVATFEYEPRIAFAGGLAIENYKNIDLGTGNILIRKTIVQKEQNKAADLTLQYTTVYQAWGTTAGGKTAASAIMASLKRATDAERIAGTYLLVDRMSSLICRGVEKSINIGRGTAPVEPKEIDKQNEKLKDKQKELNTNGSFNVTPGFSFFGNDATQLTELSFGADEASSRAEYNMQFAPDSYLEPASDGGGGGGGGDNNTGLTHVYASSSAAAYEYGKAVYTILSGMANGKSITTEFRNIPSEPMSSIYIEAAGTVGRFRANGITYAFDAQGLVAGCDAMLDGGAGLVAGGSGADWFPMAVPATNLSTLTPAVNSTPALANTIAAPGGFDPAAPGNIWSSLGTAGAGSDVYAAAVTKAAVVGSVAETVRRESVTRSLSWLLTADYDMRPQTLSLVSVTMNYGTLRNVFPLFAGAGSGVIANLSDEIIAELLLAGTGSGVIASLSDEIIAEQVFAGSGSGIITDLSVEIIIEQLFAGSGSGAIATLLAETLELFAGSGSGVIEETPTLPNPNFSLVSLQLHFEGSNNSTTFTDSSSNNLATSSVVNATISTAQSVFGGSSGRFVSNQYIQYTPQSLLQMTGDFTIEAQLYPLSSADMIAASSSADSNTQIFRLNENGAGRLSFYLNSTQVFSSTTAGITANTWQHVAICRLGSSTRMFVNGTQVGSTNTSWTGSFRIDVIGAFFVGGNLFGGTGFNGHIDELRVTKGAALYTADFTPPSQPFPDS